MPIIKRTAESGEFRKHYNIVKKMSSGMKFDDKMDKVNWKRVRLLSDIGYTFMPKEKDVTFKRLLLDGVSSVMSVPDKILSEGIVLYIHGGGLVAGSARSTKGYCSMLAKKTGCRVFSIDYALAPERPFPHGLNDCHTAYLALKKLFPDSRIAICGESGGALLCFSLIVRCLNTGTEPPDWVISHSGAFDISGAVSVNEAEVNDITVKPGVMNAVRNMYAPGMEPADPDISPYYYSDFSRFPPCVLTCDAKETLRSRSYAVYEKLTEAGVEIILYEYSGAFHAFAPIGTMAPETDALLEENSEFIRKHIG